jgi:hypothetical protein
MSFRTASTDHQSHRLDATELNEAKPTRNSPGLEFDAREHGSGMDLPAGA